MVEAGEDLRLPLEPGEPIRVRCEGVGEDLQGDLAVELRVGGLPDLAHAAFAKESSDVVVADLGAGAEGHELLGQRDESFYAQAVNGSTCRCRMPPEDYERNGGSRKPVKGP